MLKLEAVVRYSPTKEDEVNIVIDRSGMRIAGADSAQMAFRSGEGICLVKSFDDATLNRRFSDTFEADGIRFEEPTVHMFSFNNPVGACPTCEGYGKVIGIDEDLVVPNKSLSVYEDAVVCWKGEKMAKWKERVVYNAEKFDFPIHRPYFELTPDQKRMLWSGGKNFKGINAFFDYLETKKYKIQYRVMLARYRGKTTSHECQGARKKKEASWVKVNNTSMQELVLMPVLTLRDFVNRIKLNPHDAGIASRILMEIQARLQYLTDVGLGYLNLNRLSSTLSGGESQRINLATSLGSSLVGSLYILDEPSIGLHPRDTGLLVKVLKHLRDIGNTVLVVEHEEEIIRAADDIIDIGPLAGRLGGEILFQGLSGAYIRRKDLWPVTCGGRD
jgi:excinuclease ABC subunit A